MMKILITFILLFYVQLSFADSANKCVALFDQNFVSAESESIDRSIQNLAELKISLDTAKAKGSNSIELTALADNFKNKSLEFYKYVRKNNLMSKDEYIDRIKLEIMKIQNEDINKIDKNKLDEERTKREQQHNDLESREINGERAIMHKVLPGKVVIKRYLKDDEYIIKKPFYMLATPTTQIIWRKIAELAEEKLGSKYAINPDPSHFKGDTLPVESVSQIDIQIWFKALNELSKAGEPTLSEIIPDHKKGDTYRLPTEAERELVARNFKFNKSNFKDNAWYAVNSEGRTHPVAQRNPLIVNGKDFYDIYGNVAEWLYTRKRNADQYDLYVGGAWNMTDLRMYDLQVSHELGFRNSILGFRFVRNAR